MSDISYPLHWPEGRERTPEPKRKAARFKVSLSIAINDLIEELERLGARYITISTDCPGYKKRGVWRPYADAEYEDPGVAVYFDLNGDQMCMSCDRWELVDDNMRAIGLTIAAMRGIERWGASEAVNRAFTGFRHALPASGDDWKTVLGLTKAATMDDVKKAHRRLARESHPDQGGNEHEMIRVNQAVEAAKRELGAG